MTLKLSELYTVKSRFHRSVQIELDSTLDDYIVTEVSARTLRRISDAIDNPLSTRAWSITGPYGAGKSAFIVFLKNLLGNASAPEIKRARSLLEKADKRLYKRLVVKSNALSHKRGFCHALVSANREQIETAVVKALMHGVENFYANTRGKQPTILSRLKRCVKKCESGYVPPHDLVIEYCEKVASTIKTSKGAGLLLVIDELGKCLENAALNASNDIFVLQKIAEMASRSDKTPILFLTVLHQSFDRYAARLETTKRNEWSKVQGRFEDVSFVDSSEQVYKLIASAITCCGTRQQEKEIDSSTKKLFEKISGIFDSNSRKVSPQFTKVLKNCLPLHPLTTITLVPLFRSRLAQNERSLFAFLSSTERGSFFDFLNHTNVDLGLASLPMYTLPNLYDYLTSSFGVTLFTQANGKKWVEIDQALSRANDECERKIIKSIGLLSLLGESLGLAINEDIIAYSLGILSAKEKKQIKSTIQTLRKKSIIVYRRYSSSYALWGGSDIDLDEKVQDAKRNKISVAGITSTLNKLFPIRPKVAKRHLYKTGTLRYFNFRYVDVNNLAYELDQKIENADGQVLQVIQTNKNNKSPFEKIQQHLKEAPTKIRVQTIVGYAENTDRLVSVFSDLLALQWVVKNTPELQGDPIAAKEARARILQLERLVEELTNELFFCEGAQSDQKTYWIDGAKGKTQKDISKTELSNWISDICENVFDKTPTIKNELINRNRVSSSASSARRNLLHAILESADKANLGIKGYPAEMSLYKSVLQKSNIHRQSSHGWIFSFSEKTVETSWRPLVKAINQHLERNENKKVILSDLMDKLRKPPYGVREGVVPIILCTMLRAYDAEIALFEQGTFKPVIKSTDFDLISKVPHRYSVQLCRISGVKAEVFNQIIKTIAKKDPEEYQKERKSNLLDIVKMLYRFVHGLPGYVQTTSQLSEHTKNVRQCLMESKEPANLLYTELPVACGLKPASEIDNKDEDYAKEFVSKLRAALIELQRKESELFGKIENILLHTFSLSESKGKYREIIAERAERVDSLTLDPSLKGFLTRVTDQLEQKDWLDSIGSVIVGRPPSGWSDKDLLKFEHDMVGVKTRLEKYERLAIEKGLKGVGSEDEIFQISLTSSKNPERYKIIHLSPSEQEQLKNHDHEIRKQLKKFEKQLDPEHLLGVLGKYVAEVIDKNKVKPKKVGKG